MQDVTRCVVDEISPQRHAIAGQVERAGPAAIGVAAQVSECAGLIVEERTVKLLVDVLGNISVAHQAGGGRLLYLDGLAGGDARREITGFVLGAVVHARLAGRPRAEPA